MSEEVAVQGATFSYQSPITGGPTPVLGPASTKCKAGGAGMLQDGLQVTCAPGVTDGTCTTTAPAAGNMSATAQKVKAESKLVLRKGDTIDFSGIAGVLSGGSACTLSFTVEITDAGQTKVLAE